MSEFYDERETRSPEARERALMDALRAQVRHAKIHSPHYRETLADVDPDTLLSREALSALPVLYKSDLIDLQAKAPPLGGLATRPAADFKRLYLSPGPIAEPEAEHPHWRMERALWAAGFRSADIVMNTFAYHLTPAGFMFDHALAALGATVFPSGVGNTQTQASAIPVLGITGYVGTPDFLKAILEKGDEHGIETGTIARAMVTGGPLFPSLREFYAARGIAVRQCYGTAELGLIGYETEPGAGLVLDEDAVVEIVRPGTGDPVAPGEVGEVVVTTFNAAYPLIRFATGDLSAELDTPSSCGRTGRRLKGWMGRADQTTKVRGMFVHPRQVAAIVNRFARVHRARLVIDEDGGADKVLLKVEVADGDEALAAAVAEAIRTECRVRGDVAFVDPGSLPNDGKVIDDVRKLEA
ncbi:AMP-dependent synthetase [Acuticoccus sediminis]|uniref:AMP-dependent synthetase n=1 Tax=Acuticoccus sediminis TaxID=2184697 RepID=A0A8B2NP44_9HYPH|nr:AMP-binding protein [Acuticoccus sediminis]RAH99757.1 AMP-dependent synthetase [Acuticoccus sediminis]